MNATDLRAERAVGEPQHIRYDERRHPGIARRMFLSGFSPDEVAAYLGVTTKALKAWRDEHAAMRDAWSASIEANGRIAEALFNMAMEYDEDKGQYVGKNAGLLKFLAQSRLGWREQGLPDTDMPTKAQERLTTERAAALLEKLSERPEDDIKTVASTDG